jgi:glutathione S-transferase
VSKPKLYGIAGSRALRSLWAIEECGIEYEHISVNYAAESKSIDYLAVNPNGRIPALQDGDLTLFESMAINLYLAKKYGGDLYPASAADEARALQWSVWVIAEVEGPQMELVVHKFFTPDEKKSDKVPAIAAKKLARPLQVLDDALASRDWLVGDAFSVADLNVAGVMLLLKLVGFDYSDRTHIQHWADSCYQRPALKRAEAVGS